MTSTTEGARGRRRAASGQAVGLAVAALTATTALACVSLRPYSDVVAEVAEGALVAVDGRRVHVERRGAGEPVVLLHGFGGSTYSWRTVASLLADDFEVLSVDLAGFGWSERPQSKEPYTRFGQGETVLGVMDALGLDAVHLVGHSYGGAVAAALAARRPDRFATLTLVDAAAPEYPQARRSRLAAFRPLVFAYVRTVGLRRGRVVDGLRRSVADDSLLDDGLVDEYRRRLTIEGASWAFWGLTAPADDPQGEVPWRALTLPVLVVWGEEDALISVETARRAAAEIPCARFVTLAGVGHLPMEEAPVRLASQLRSFLAGEDRPCRADGTATVSGHDAGIGLWTGGPDAARGSCEAAP